MTRDELEALTHEELLELALDLDRINRQAVFRIETDWGNGTFNKPAVLRILRGERRHLTVVSERKSA